MKVKVEKQPADKLRLELTYDTKKAPAVVELTARQIWDYAEFLLAAARADRFKMELDLS